jgi:hypothetical protein
MNEDLLRIRRLLRAARRRWFWHTAFGCAAHGLFSVAVVFAAWFATRMAVPGARGAVALAAGTAIALSAAIVWAVWPMRRRPTDAQVARFVEERCPQLEDRLVTAVECGAGQIPHKSEAIAGLLYRDAATRLGEIDLDATVSRRAVRRNAAQAAVAALALVAVAALAWHELSGSAFALAQAAWPPRADVHVAPGDARLVAGSSFTVRAQVANAPDGTTPVVVLDDRAGRAEHPMTARPSKGEFEYTVGHVAENFHYSVRARSSRSAEYHVTVLRPARVTRIDARYQYPAGSGTRERVEEDGGDVYGPPGTRVQLIVHTDKPVRDGALALADRTSVALTSQSDRALGGVLTITDDSSYRVALIDREGLRNPGETEYFIRLLADSPPDVRIVRPTADRQVTPLEEVPIAAHADDDHAIRDFDLVYSVRGGPEKSVPFATHGDARSVDGARTLFLEDLHVRSGDFLTYYARASDRGAGGASAEARSDIFFLEITPFDQEFVPPQSQASGPGVSRGAPGRSLEDLIRAQKAIVVATWRLDSRSRRVRSAASQDDVRTVARAQGEVKKRAMEAAGPGFALATGESDGNPMANAIDAMGRAEDSLNAVRTAQALPQETRALNELMRAQASERRRQLLRASGPGSAGDSGNGSADLSTMFDRELQRQQKTNYEMPQNVRRQDPKENEALERLRQLAERQGDLSQRQQDLERDRQQMSADEVKRRLERLTREQSDLRQQAEQLAQQMRSRSPRGTGQSGQPRGAPGAAPVLGTPGGRPADGSVESALRDASDAMGQAATRLRDGKVFEAGRQGEQALGKLKSAEEHLRRQQGAGADGPAIGDLQMLARQLADAQRELAKQASAAGSPSRAADAMRRLAGEKERLADQAERLQKGVKSASGNAALEGRQRQVLEGVARDLDRLQLPRQIRDSAAAIRAPERGDVNRPESAAIEEDLARTFDRLADRLAGAAGSRDTQLTSDRLGRTREMKDRLAQIERQMAELQRQVSSGRQAQAGKPGAQGGGADAPVGTSGRDADPSAALQRLREQYQRELQRAAEHLDDLRRQGGATGFTPEGQGEQILSARGYNQNFGRWEQLAHGINVGLDRAETVLSERLRTQQARDRLQAPPTGRAPEQYRRLVEQYYQSLAGKVRK